MPQPGVARLRLGQPDRGDLRVGEHHLRHGRVVGRRDVLAPRRRVHRPARGPRADRRADDPRVVLALVGQRRPAGDVARRVQPLPVDTLHQPGVVDGQRPGRGRPSPARGRRRSAGARWRPAARRRPGSPARRAARSRPRPRRPSRARCPAARPRPSRRSAAATISDATGSADGSSRDPRTSSTTSEPSRRQACASSQPTTPPPSTPSRRGTACADVASRLVQVRTESRPGIGGRTGRLPVATTTACRGAEHLATDLDTSFPRQPRPAPDHRDPRALGPLAPGSRRPSRG